MFNKVKRVMTVLFILLLGFLFTVPRLYLNACCDELEGYARQAMQAEYPGEALHALEAAYERQSGMLRLFLNHAAVDAIGAAVAAAVPLRETEAKESALSALLSAICALRRVEGISVGGLF